MKSTLRYGVLYLIATLANSAAAQVSGYVSSGPSTGGYADAPFRANYSNNFGATPPSLAMQGQAAGQPVTGQPMVAANTIGTPAKRVIGSGFLPVNCNSPACQNGLGIATGSYGVPTNDVPIYGRPAYGNPTYGTSTSATPANRSQYGQQAYPANPTTTPPSSADGSAAYSVASINQQLSAPLVTDGNGYGNGTTSVATTYPNLAAGSANGFCADGSCGNGVSPDMGDYGYAMSGSWGDAAVVPAAKTAPTWFGGIYGLLINRSDRSDVHFLVDPTVANRTYLSTDNADMELSGGYEVRIGRTFCNGAWGLEAIYWELFPDLQQAAVGLPSTPSAALWGAMDYSNVWLDYSGGADTIPNLFTNGNIYAARIHRDFDFRNIEVNLISRPLYAGGGIYGGRCRGLGTGCGGSMIGNACSPGVSYGPAIGGRMPSLGIGGRCSGCGAAGCGGACGAGAGVAPIGPGGYGTAGLATAVGGCGSGACGVVEASCPPRLMVGWLFGVRYFKFDEKFCVDYDTTDEVFDGADPDTEFGHFADIENEMVGVQLGLNMDYYLTSGLVLEAGSKFGFYGNHMSQWQRIYNGFGDAYVIPGSPQDINIRSDKEDVSYLGELRVGLASKIGCHCRLNVGYRVMALSGIALSTNQLQYGGTYTDVAGIANIDRDGSLILHGSYVGMEFAW